MANIQNHYFQSDGYSIDGFCHMRYDDNVGNDGNNGYEADNEENVLQYKFSNMQIVSNAYYNNPNNNLNGNLDKIDTITIKFKNLKIK